MVRERVLEAMRVIHQGSPADVRRWLAARYPDERHDIGAAMWDLATPQPRSSEYGPGRGFLIRVAWGTYRLVEEA